MKRIITGLLACGLVLSWAGGALAADPRPTENVSVPKTFRMTKLHGTEVRNLQNEKLGTVADFVVNMDTGTINYIALGSGGVLGVGEKLFAIPFNELQMKLDGNNMFFVVNVSKTKLDNAKGFDKEHWPDTAPAGFAEQIDHNAATPRPNAR
ncbi:MAG TPA: PRC-barrel domain-containing protein [Pirellulales bacterium]|jgi:sporulation protein YlmC with PRC-barrel domain|nr:PRC-barrel domain-containing protein [Pirellulales bacterium]